MILLVDDDSVGLMVRKQLLEACGYEVLRADGGRDALTLCAEHPVRLAIIDYDMPDMNGTQVAAELKRLRPDVRILLLSGYVDLPEEDLQWADRRAVKGSVVAFLKEVQHLVSS